jgi:hypothetical protein
MQSRLSTHSPEGSVADDEVPVCAVVELSPLVLAPVPVLVVVVVVPAVDEVEV